MNAFESLARELHAEASTDMSSAWDDLDQCEKEDWIEQAREFFYPALESFVLDTRARVSALLDTHNILDGAGAAIYKRAIQDALGEITTAEDIAAPPRTPEELKARARQTSNPLEWLADAVMLAEVRIETTERNLRREQERVRHLEGRLDRREARLRAADEAVEAVLKLAQRLEEGAGWAVQPWADQVATELRAPLAAYREAGK